jgi:hypothetical protein
MPTTGGGAPLQNITAKNIDPSLQGVSNENASLQMQMPRNFDMQYYLTDVVNLTKTGQRIPDGNRFTRVIGHHAMPWFESVTRKSERGSR